MGANEVVAEKELDQYDTPVEPVLGADAAGQSMDTLLASPSMKR
jgi:hypothetical protein